MSEHDQIQEQLAIYPALEPNMHRQIAQHISVCPQCADTLAAYQKMDQALHQLTHDKLRYLAAQPMIAPKPNLARSRGNRFWPHLLWRERVWERFTKQPAVVLQLAGASVLILLLIMMSLLVAGWQQNEQHLLASTPTVVEPVATATPANPGVWASQLAIVEADHGEVSVKLASTVGQRAEATLIQVHFHWRMDNFIDQTSVLPLPKRQVATPWNSIVATTNV